jgi:hypothetical protein
MEKIASEMKDNQAPNPQQLLSEDTSLTHIDLYSFLPAPHSPLVIRSLMEPIGQAWAPIEAEGSEAAIAISNFWFYRRTRPLMEFIPAPRPHIHAMVRGWYVGHLLGLIDTSRQKSAVRIVDPWDENLNRFEFPYPTLSPSENDNLATLLESLALAYVRVGVDDNIESLYPYVLLRRLGTSTQGRSLTYWGELNDLCRTWLSDGVVKGSRQELMLAPDAASEDMSAGQRRGFAVQELKSIRDDFAHDYRIWMHETDDNSTRLGQPPLWPGMWQTIERSLSQLIATFATERAEKPVKKVR